MYRDGLFVWNKLTNLGQDTRTNSDRIISVNLIAFAVLFMSLFRILI